MTTIRMMCPMAVGDAIKDKVLRSLLQAALLVVVGALAGAVFNTVRHEGLPWSSKVPAPGAEGAVPSVSAADAWREYRKGLVQFIDARSAGEYEAGHLPGALSLPVEQTGELADRVRIPAGRTAVIYCSDPACPKSAQLASLLSKRGLTGLKVMPEGWAGWYEAGLPYEEKGGG